MGIKRIVDSLNKLVKKVHKVVWKSFEPQVMVRTKWLEHFFRCT
jgi:hypothetical protein